MGLLDDDREYIDGIIETSFWASAYYVRNLFAVLLMSYSMTSPKNVFQNTWECLSDDILRRQRKTLNMPDLQISEAELQNFALEEIEKILQQNGSSLRKFESMPFPNQAMTFEANNKLIQEELHYDKSALKEEYKTLYNMLTSEQKIVFSKIHEAILSDQGGIFFLYGYGGTGKTFLWRTLSADVRSQGNIVLNVASSGIASLLLPGGRTAHSRFVIPLNINENSTCHIKPGSELPALIIRAKLIIWDEAMMSKYCFEALDRTLKDIIRSTDGLPNKLPFAGKTVVLGGDFRQILPVIPKGSREDIVYRTINSSYLWEFCTVLTLTKNMRLSTQQDASEANAQEIAEFSNWILNIGNGDIGENVDGLSQIQIPEDNIILDVDNPIDAIVQNIYPCIHTDFSNDGYFDEKAILAPTHRVVEAVNEKVLSMIPGDQREYLSSDTVCTLDNISGNNAELYSTDYLNSIKCSGIPNHRLLLKIGVPIMLLRNIDQKAGLCNGTRLIITRMGNHIIEARIISTRNNGKKVYIPRMTLTNSDETTSVRFKRRQFPILLCFAMTINKS